MRLTDDTTDGGRTDRKRICDALKAAQRRRSDEELTLARLIGYAYHALPADATLDDVRPVAADLLDGERHASAGVDEADDEPARELATDGGRYYLPDVGERAVDRRDDDGGELVVVATHPETAAHDYTVEALDGLTVAEVNEEYDAAAPVVEVVYVDEADATLDRWRDVEDLRDAVHYNAVCAYSFPADRLAPVSGGEAA